MSSNPHIAVIGSLNLDLTCSVPRLPRPGETLTATSATAAYGGKGANQAVAAHRAGAHSNLIGCMGSDQNGRSYRAYLAELGVDVRLLRMVDDQPTGLAFINVDADGENTIVVHPGANHAITPKQVVDALSSFEKLDGILLQLECPLPAVQAATNWAKDAGVIVLLNPSPWDDALNQTPLHADIWIVNETEAAQLSPTIPGMRVVTRGAKPTQVFQDGACIFEQAPPSVQPIDTVGAGDAFAGAFAVAHLEGQPLAAAIGFANAAGALATQKLGAQTAIASREEIVRIQRGG